MILWKTNEYLGSMRIPPYSIGAISVSLLLGRVTGPYAPVWKAETRRPPTISISRPPQTEQWLRDCSCLNRTFLWVGAQKRVGSVVTSLVQINRTSLMT